MALVTFVIATYNDQHQIIEVLRSVAQQNYRDVEIVVVDCGSTDRTVKRVLGFAAHSRRRVQTVLLGESAGLTQALFYGVEVAGPGVIIARPANEGPYPQGYALDTIYELGNLKP